MNNRHYINRIKFRLHLTRFDRDEKYTYLLKIVVNIAQTAFLPIII